MKLRPKLLMVIFLAISILASIWLYRDSLGSYFFQDDWFSFRISQTENTTQFFQFFIPRRDVIYYRPLGMQVPFYLIYKLFGLNPLAFRILTITTHAINIILVYYLIMLITKNQFTSLIASYLYSTSLVHYTSMYWSATYSFVLGPTFFFLLFINYLKRNYLASFIIFIAGILVNEIIITAPLILWSYNLFIKKDNKLKEIIPFFLVIGSLFLIRFFIFPVPTYGDYELSLGKHILNNLQAYLLWSFNWPEEMKAQFVNFYTLNPEFVKDFPWYYLIFVASLIINTVLFYLVPFFSRRFKSSRKSGSIFAFSFLWFIVALIPVLLFPKHSFSYYLPISLVGLLLLSSQLLFYLFAKIRKKFPLGAYLVILIILVNWYYTSVVGIDFNTLIHWAVRRAKISENLTKSFFKERMVSKKIKFSVLDTSENRLSLNNQDAVKFLFGDNSEVIYVKVKY